jgi:hypothetical protein
MRFCTKVEFGLVLWVLGELVILGLFYGFWGSLMSCGSVVCFWCLVYGFWGVGFAVSKFYGGILGVNFKVSNL